mmetsp:Transcript_38483/g.108768  ORF Transcript_38483/g.108768 Transcript_38483/m.108768 type:complete len:209 (+) Transcript_38483:496-1122(+)
MWDWNCPRNTSMIQSPNFVPTMDRSSTGACWMRLSKPTFPHPCLPARPRRPPPTPRPPGARNSSRSRARPSLSSRRIWRLLSLRHLHRHRSLTCQNQRHMQIPRLNARSPRQNALRRLFPSHLRTRTGPTGTSMRATASHILRSCPRSCSIIPVLQPFFQPGSGSRAGPGRSSWRLPSASRRGAGPVPLAAGHGKPRTFTLSRTRMSS